MSWITKIMGNRNSNYLTELSEDSSDSEFDYNLEPRLHKEMPNVIKDVLNIQDLGHEACTLSDLEIPSTKGTLNPIESNLTTDAAIKTCLKPELALNLDNITDLENNLEQYEMVSLTYLLYEDANFALQELVLFLEGAQKSLVKDWANVEQSRSNPWQRKLIEALCIIKNYQILRSLGYTKQDVITDYLPQHAFAAININKVKKAVYLICEKLNRDKTNRFLENIKREFEAKGLAFVDYFNQEYLELYFLYWETIGYASTRDMSSVKQVFKVMEEESLCNILESVFTGHQDSGKEKNQVDVEAMPKARSTSTDTHQRGSTSKQHSGGDFSMPPNMGQDNTAKPEDSDKYEIDPQQPGVLLIINQEEFYTEFDKQHKSLLPEDIAYNKLETREGTERDKEELTNTFRRFGFDVIVENNLTHEELINTVKETVKKIRNESSLFVCIMSHGDKGVVFGSNSCRVEVSKIQDIMCTTNKHLVGKPKILILQSCQGKQCQKLSEIDEEEDEYSNHSMTTDGPNTSRPTVPRTVDMFTFWATVPGYAAIRHKKTGSWFIQALCKKMIELGDKHHFEDICTRIVNDVSNRTWTVHEFDKNAMTPMKMSTLRKAFYLPPIRKD